LAENSVTKSMKGRTDEGTDGRMDGRTDTHLLMKGQLAGALPRNTTNYLLLELKKHFVAFVAFC